MTVSGGKVVTKLLGAYQLKPKVEELVGILSIEV